MKRIIEAIRLNVLNKAQTVTELYNLEEDPSETTDLVAKFPEKVKELELLMDKEHTESQEFSFCSGIKQLTAENEDTNKIFGEWTVF